MADLITKIFINNGVTAIGLEEGYVHSITYNGKLFCEFDKGPNSGWMYKVNGDIPNVGINSFVLSDGDVVSYIILLTIQKKIIMVATLIGEMMINLQVVQVEVLLVIQLQLLQQK